MIYAMTNCLCLQLRSAYTRTSASLGTFCRLDFSKIGGTDLLVGNKSKRWHRFVGDDLAALACASHDCHLCSSTRPPLIVIIIIIIIIIVIIIPRSDVSLR